MYRIYSHTEGIPAALVSEIFSCTDTFEQVAEVADADFLAYPTHYQVAYDYAPIDFVQHSVPADIQPLLQQRFAELETLAKQYQKKIIAVYIRDNSKPLPSENAIVFRSSLTASGRQKNEFAFPTNGRPLPKLDKHCPSWQAWTARPSVGFRGQAAPMQLPLVLRIKNAVNQIALRNHWKPPFPIQYNFGYLHRRNALKYLKANKRVQLDYCITSPTDIFDAKARESFADTLLQNQYAICVSGHGNYSFRLYETMEAGRIPLFVNTDCVLPLEEIIDYKNLFVWVEANDLNKINNSLQFFHDQHQHDLEQLQQKVQKTWQQYLAANQYYRHLPFYLRHFKIV